MTQAEARALTAKLFAAYPNKTTDLTAAVYVEKLEPLNYPVAVRAVDELICSEKWMPTVASVLEVYWRIEEAARERRAVARGLAEPPLTEEQKQENARQARALLERLGGSGIGWEIPASPVLKRRKEEAA